MSSLNTSLQVSKKGNGSTKLAGLMATACIESPCWEEIVAVAAYYRAERRGFAPGNEMEDWLQAEADCQAGPHQPGQGFGV